MISLGKARMAVLVCVMLGIPTYSWADLLLGTSTYTYTGSGQTYTAPANTNYVVVKMWGAGGGTGVYTPGGGGGMVTVSYAISGGQTITVYVGGAGQGYMTGGWPWGGSAQGLGGAGGGSGSAVTMASGTAWVGGGGGGGNGGSWGSNGGAGGGPNGANGGSPSGGYGGTTSAGGAGGSGNYPGNSGMANFGGNGGANNGYVGGGGGGGGYGGGGGASGSYSATGSNGGGGGGGGSSAVIGSPISYSFAAGSGSTPGGTSDPDFPGSSYAYGGPYGVYQNGCPGYVIIKAYRTQGPPYFTSTPSTQNWNQGQAPSFSIPATGNPLPTFSATGLPTGLTVTSSTGAITGTATTAGTFSATLSATNSYGTVSDPQTWNIAAAVFTLSSYVSPTTLINGGGNSTTLYRDATANFGIAWTENTIWHPDGSGEVLGNCYAPNPLGSTVYTPSAGPGIYYWQVRVVDNYSNYADQLISFQVNSATVNAPTSLSSSSVYSTSLTLSWSAAAGSFPIASYGIYRNSTLLGWWTGGTTYTDTGLTPGTTYTYTVVTKDNQGNLSSPSSPISVPTAADFELFLPIP